MSIDRLNYLKRIVTVTMISHLAPDEQADLTALIDAEIKRIESRRKVPLVPCRCGRKQIEQWRTPVLGRVHIEYSCPDCSRHGGRCGTDREARIAWNEAKKGGEK